MRKETGKTAKRPVKNKEERKAGTLLKNRSTNKRAPGLPEVKGLNGNVSWKWRLGGRQGEAVSDGGKSIKLFMSKQRRGRILGQVQGKIDCRRQRGIPSKKE